MHFLWSFSKHTLVEIISVTIESFNKKTGYVYNLILPDGNIITEARPETPRQILYEVLPRLDINKLREYFDVSLLD